MVRKSNDRQEDGAANAKLSPGKIQERVQFAGIDSWNRPIFKSLDKKRHFYGSVRILFGYEANEEEVLARMTVDDLVYMGSSFGCEPYGIPVDNLTIVRKNSESH